MRLLRFIEKKRTFRRTFAYAAEIADFTKSRTQQQTERFLILKFAHVETKQLGRAEYFGCRHDHRFRFADACWSKQQKTSAWPRGLCQSEFATPHSGDDSWQRVGL